MNLLDFMSALVAPLLLGRKYELLVFSNKRDEKEQAEFIHRRRGPNPPSRIPGI